MKIGNPATRSSNEAARIIIGSMDLNGKKRTMKNRKVLFFRETLGF